MAKLETTLIWLIMSAFIASSGAMLESKNQSSFTIALVGPFGWYPGLQADENREIISDKNMDLSLVSDGILPYHPYFGFFWMQAVVQVFCSSLWRTQDSILWSNTAFLQIT
ncbi:hypothetical protein BDR26DRAFT_676034 [Obelidium mucronatum]|nr:hypothetical protein BDR26DRAFT_676034 [Obelidium mucronatum]